MALGGSSEAGGVRRLGQVLAGAGFGVLRLNLRGAGPGRSLAAGTYAAACNRDLLPVLHQIAGLAAPAPLLGVGLSLGGTVLLNAALAEPGLLAGLVCVSSPLDLAACSDQIGRPRNRLYQRWLLRRLIALTLGDPFGFDPAEQARLQGPGAPAPSAPSMPPSPHRAGATPASRPTTATPPRCSACWPARPCRPPCWCTPWMIPGCPPRPPSSWLPPLLPPRLPMWC